MCFKTGSYYGQITVSYSHLGLKMDCMMISVPVLHEDIFRPCVCINISCDLSEYCNSVM
jgi:hypothetical protein